MTDGRFVDEDGAVADCWDGPPSRCFEWGEFVGNGEVNTIYEVEAKPCGQRREVEYVAVLEERTSWEFLGRAGDRDEFLVDQRVWMFDATPNAQTGTYTVTVDGTTYEMNRQFDEW